MPVEQVTVPDIGGAEGAEVIELLVAVGDLVTLDQSLIVLESDKASMEIPSTLAGTVVELLVAEGDQLAEGAPIVRIEVAGDAADAVAAESETPAEVTSETVEDEQSGSASEVGPTGGDAVAPRPHRNREMSRQRKQLLWRLRRCKLLAAIPARTPQLCMRVRPFANWLANLA